MKHKRNVTGYLFYGVLLLNFMGAGQVFAYQAIHDEKLMTKITYNYLRSFATAEASPAVTTPSQQQQTKQKRDFMLHTDKVTLAESTQRKVVLRTIFSQIEANRVATAADLLNYNAWTDLAFFCGPSSNPSYHLLSRINRTTTVLGECALAVLLTTPTSDIDTLSNRQRMVQLLLEQPACLTALKEVLEAYRKVEPSLLSFWTPTDPLYTKEYREYMRRRFLSDSAAVNKVARKLNRRIFFRNCRDIYGEFVALPLIGSLLCTSQYLMASMSKGGFLQASIKDSFEAFPFFVPGYSIVNVLYNYRHIDGKPSLLLPLLGATAMNGLAVWRGYCGVKNYQEYQTVFRHLATRMRDVQCLIKTMQRLNNIVETNQALEAVCGPSLQAIRALLRTSQDEIGMLVDNFLNMKFDNWSYLFGNGGKLLATYNLFEEHRDCLRSAMYALGQLDSFVSVATLVEEASTRHPEHPYTFTKFLDRSEQRTPYIQLNAMWHPMLDPETVVANEVEMDAHKTRNMVLCGPNAGGKSSFLSGVATSLLLSQTFGIAPAKNAVITPFNKIRSYIAVGDNMASGASLFMVEIDRMQRYINTLEESKPDEFIFSIADELFSGTNPVEGGAAAYSTIACIAKYTNALHIVSSHYPIVMGLAHAVKGGGIRNFKVFVKEAPDQKLHYTYKIIPGEANQAVALRLLEQEGYDQALLKQAKYMVQNPEKFYKLHEKVSSKHK